MAEPIMGYRPKMVKPTKTRIMKKIYVIGLCAVLLFTTCQQDEIIIQTQETVNVPLTLNTEVQTTTGSRAATPLIPDVENLIYDLWVVQYDHEGIITKNPAPKHYRKDAQGLLSVTESITLATGESTICMIVNMGYNSDEVPITFPDNLTQFKQTLAEVDVEAAANGTLQRIPMCGYWQGEISTTTKTLSVTLGRMMTRINLILNNQTGGALNEVKAILNNVPNQAHVFPSISSEANKPSTITLTDEIGNIASGSSVTRYFYIAPNLWEQEATTLKLTATGKNELSIRLGNDSPDVTGGNSKLYPNNIYTFTINLKN